MTSDSCNSKLHWNDQKRLHQNGLIKETSTSNVDTELKTKNHPQHKNGLIFKKTIPGTLSNVPSVSYFYPAQSKNNRNKSANGHSSENGDVKVDEERILPVHLNPILLQDLKDRHSSEKFRRESFNHQTESGVIRAADDIQDGEYAQTTELEYGKGFVQKLLNRLVTTSTYKSPNHFHNITINVIIFL